MAIFNTPTLIRSLSLLHLTTAYYLLTKPSILPTQNLVLVLGASMKLPITTSALSIPTTATALAALFLAVLAVNDLLSATMTQFAYDEYWSAQAPVRCGIWMLLTVWVYASGRNEEIMGLDGGLVGKKGGFAGELKNSFVFAVGFVEMSIMFWIFLALRDERKKAAMEIVEKRRMEEDSL
ncbi:MAG: hypothetical protein M1828_000146 [Chrysothrix sp. TS-e1954]|nr:MAG: hypothetical protein M1828_000146 [Chrysothrix sp. TS-e1954]